MLTDIAQRVEPIFRLEAGIKNKCSLDNLLCYLALMGQDLSRLQIRLAEEGFPHWERLKSMF